MSFIRITYTVNTIIHITTIDLRDSIYEYISRFSYIIWILFNGVFIS